jgi:hypothetical protein
MLLFITPSFLALASDYERKGKTVGAFLRACPVIFVHRLRVSEEKGIRVIIDGAGEALEHAIRDVYLCKVIYTNAFTSESRLSTSTSNIKTKDLDKTTVAAKTKNPQDLQKQIPRHRGINKTDQGPRKGPRPGKVKLILQKIHGVLACRSSMAP